MGLGLGLGLGLGRAFGLRSRVLVLPRTPPLLHARARVFQASLLLAPG